MWHSVVNGLITEAPQINSSRAFTGKGQLYQAPCNGDMFSKTNKKKTKTTNHMVSEMAQEERILANRPDNLSSVFRTHMVGGKADSWRPSFEPAHLCQHMHTHTLYLLISVYHSTTTARIALLSSCCLLGPGSKEQLTFWQWRAKCTRFVKE